MPLDVFLLFLSFGFQMLSLYFLRLKSGGVTYT